MYISFLGTDKTINGWKEDFNMTFMDNIPGQISGLEYLENISKKYPDTKIRLGGHSKGGNIAIYSALLSSDNTKNKIIKVDNFDGPGLNSTIIDKYGSDKIINKMETFIPQESIVGRLFNHKEKITICKSNGKGILQHDIYTWCIFKDKLIQVNKNTKVSEHINNTVTEWLTNTTAKQRKIFTDTVFELLYGSGVDSFDEIIFSIPKALPKILKKYKAVSIEDKNTMTEMIKKFIVSYFNIIRKNNH